MDDVKTEKTDDAKTEKPAEREGLKRAKEEAEVEIRDLGYSLNSVLEQLGDEIRRVESERDELGKQIEVLQAEAEDNEGRDELVQKVLDFERGLATWPELLEEARGG